MSKNKKDNKYPEKLFYIPNSDKKNHEVWYSGRDKLNFPHPYRCVLVGRPNSGKTNIIKNILIRAYPKFQDIFLYHCGGIQTKEYDDINYHILEKIPNIESDIFDPLKKSLLIIEDKDYLFMKKEELKNLFRTFGFKSTHSNLSIIATAQLFTSLPVPVRRMSNIIILWKTKDIDCFKMIGRRVNLSITQMKDLIKNYLKEPRDSLWIDNTFNSPYKLRINGFKIIKLKEEKN